MAGIENRRAQRDSHNSVLEVYDSGGEKLLWTARLKDYSRVGACFASTKQLQRGEKLRCRIRLLQAGVLEVFGHIVWCRSKNNSNLYGLEFDLVKRLQQ